MIFVLGRIDITDGVWYRLKSTFGLLLISTSEIHKFGSKQSHHRANYLSTQTQYSNWQSLKCSFVYSLSLSYCVYVCVFACVRVSGLIEAGTLQGQVFMRPWLDFLLILWWNMRQAVFLCPWFMLKCTSHAHTHMYSSHMQSQTQSRDFCLKQTR